MSDQMDPTPGTPLEEARAWLLEHVDDYRQLMAGI